MIANAAAQPDQHTRENAASARCPPKVAYIMSRFPKLTETFILYEILALHEQRVAVEIYPLLRARRTEVHPEGASWWRKLRERFTRASGLPAMHPEAEPLVQRAHFTPFLSWPIIRSNLAMFCTRPGKYLGTLGTLIRATLGSPNYLFGGLAIFPKSVHFARLMQEAGISHVHAHFANHPATAAFIIHRLGGIPYSFTAHGADLQVDQHMLREKVAEAEFVVTVSRYNKQLFDEVCGRELGEKVGVIHCGVDTNVFQPRSSSANNHTDEEPLRILCVGTMYEVKGHTYLIEACRLLKQRGVALVCDLVGEGPDREKLAEQVFDSGLAREVRFLGPRTSRDICQLLQQTDISVTPSVPTNSGRREGIPVVLMEAMASGVPVISSRISGIPELVDHEQSGLLIPPRDPEALADALQMLYYDPSARTRLGTCGREKVAAEFDLRGNAALLARQLGKEDRQ